MLSIKKLRTGKIDQKLLIIIIKIKLIFLQKLKKTIDNFQEKVVKLEAKQLDNQIKHLTPQVSLIVF